MRGFNVWALPRGNTRRAGARRGVSAGWVIAAVVTMTAGAGWAADEPATRPIDAPRVDWSSGQQVYRMVEKWVHDAQPSKPMEGEAILVSDVAGIEVTLRWPGMTMGAGQATIESYHPTEAGTVDLTSMARGATLAAMLEVEEKLRAYKKRAEEAGVDKTKTGAPGAALTFEALASDLLVDVQIAHRLSPVKVPAGAGIEAVFVRFAPGFHGLRLTTRGAEPKSSWLWPGDALAANVGAEDQIRELMLKTGLKLELLPSVGRAGGPVLERFEVIHMVRPSKDEPVAQLVRGNVLLPRQSLDQATLEALSERIAGHIMHVQHEDGTLGGDYDPSRDKYDPMNAGESDAALMTYALARWGEPSGGQDPTQAMLNAQMAVHKSIHALLKPMLEKDHPADLSGDSFVLLTLVESAQFVDRKVERDNLSRKILALRNADGQFRSGEAADAPPASHPTQALAMAALAALYRETREETLGAAVQSSLDKLWDTTDPVKAIGSLPWLLKADSAYRSVEVNDPGAAGKRRKIVQRLGPVIDLLLARQITHSPLVGPADVVGGFEIAEPNPDLPPNPDWRTAQILEFLALAIRQRDLNVGRTRVEGLVSCGLAARFLAQLMYDQPSCYYMRDGDEAVGGVRTVLWDNRLSPAPTAMALLATVELRTTLAAWERQREHPGE